MQDGFATFQGEESVEARMKIASCVVLLLDGACSAACTLEKL